MDKLGMVTPMSPEAEFEAMSGHLDALVQEFEGLPFPEVRDMAFDMLYAVDYIHRTALQRLIGYLKEHGQTALLDSAAADPLIHTLLVLYDLVQDDETVVVEAALDTVRPYLESHGGAVELLQVAEGVVTLRLGGACDGCAAVASTLQRAIAEALTNGYPNFKRIETAGRPSAEAVPLPSLPVLSPFISTMPMIPLTPMNGGAAAGPQPRYEQRGPVFTHVAARATLQPGCMQHFDLDGTRVLVANIDGEIYAVHNQCPVNASPLDQGTFTPPVVVCPWHNEAYDLRTGKRVDGTPGQSLMVLPVAVIDGQIQLAINTTVISTPTRL
ncbi:MAG: hypothetical protein NVS4B8_03780 [Herpetosiphon sp.]